MNLDRISQDAVSRHRTQRLKLYMEAILADHVQHHGIAETRKMLQWWDEQLKEFG